MLSPQTRRRIVAGSAVLYLMFIVLVAGWPTPVDRPIGGDLDRLLAFPHDPVGVPVLVDYSFVEFTMNIVLFAPAGLLVALLVPARRWWLVAALGGLFSLLIELAQANLLPERTASALDVLANSLGACLGAALATIRPRSPR